MDKSLSETLDQILDSIRVGNQVDYVQYINKLDLFQGKIDAKIIEGFKNLVQASYAVRCGDSKTSLESGKKALELLTETNELFAPQKLESYLVKARNFIGLSLSNMGRRNVSI